MKVNPEMGNVVNVITKGKDDQYARKTQDALSRERIEDIISVENKQASRSRVENVEEAKEILALVTRDMGGASSRLYTLNEQRIARVIS